MQSYALDTNNTKSGKAEYFSSIYRRVLREKAAKVNITVTIVRLSTIRFGTKLNEITIGVSISKTILV